MKRVLFLCSLYFLSSLSFAVQGDFREETIYFLIPSRFYDGDSSNNFYNRERIEIGDPHWRGDFKGLIEQLDYIKNLGFTAIWITPPVENRSGLDYHGYHAYDWTKIDPRLESSDVTYETFIKKAHQKGFKIIQDVVINHSSNYGIRNKVWINRLPLKYFRNPSTQPSPPYTLHFGNYLSPFREDNDNPLAPPWFRERQESDEEGEIPLKDPVSGLTVPKNQPSPVRFMGTDLSTLDTEWYHRDGWFGSGDWVNPKAIRRKSLAADAIDLATENENVQEYLNAAILRYLDLGVDALRIDTAKHVERDELLEKYIKRWKEQNPGLFVFGEVLVHGTGWGNLDPADEGPSEIRPWWYTRTGKDPVDPESGEDSGLSVLDFSLFSTFKDNVTQGTFKGLSSIFSKDWIYGDATKLVTFFQNHDLGPDKYFKYRYGGDPSRAAMAYTLLWTARGIPTLYYGEEVQFQKGESQDIDKDHRFLSKTGRAYFGEYLERKNLRTTESHPLYLHLQRLNLIRKNIPALQKAPMSQWNELEEGFSFIRDYEKGKSVALIALSATKAQNFKFSKIKNGIYRDAVTGNEIEVLREQVEFQVPAYSAGIYVLDGPGKIGEDGPFLH